MVKHDKLEITGKVKSDSAGAVLYFKIKKYGYLTIEQMSYMIKQGFEFFYQQQQGPQITDFKVKIVEDEMTGKHYFLIGSNGIGNDNIDLMSITEVPDSKLTDPL